MGYTKKEWKDRISQYPTRRKLEKTDGSTETVTVSRAEGTVSQEGDAFSAENMNDMEERIDQGFQDIGVQYNQETDKVQVRYNEQWVDVWNVGAQWDGTLLSYANTYESYTGGYTCGANVTVTENGLYFSGAESASWDEKITVRTGLLDTLPEYSTLRVVMTSAPTNYLRIAFETESGTEYMLFDSSSADKNKTTFDISLKTLPGVPLRLKILGKNKKYIQSLRLLKQNKGFRTEGDYIQYGVSAEMSVAASSPKNVDVVFETEYAEKPVVLVSGERVGEDSVAGMATVTVLKLTTKGFTARVANTASSTYTYRFHWIAIGS